MTTTTTTIPKGKRLSGKDADRLHREVAKLYAKGASIREIATETGRSYGWVHRSLVQGGATLRGRGGATRTKSTK